MNAPETRTVVVEREFSHPPERLWRALTQPHLIAEWLMKNDFQPVVGHRFQLSGDWGGILDCEVLELAPNARLSYTWVYEKFFKTIVTFTLTPTRSGTHLRMEQSGFDPKNKQAIGGAHAGWKQFFAKLDQVLARND
jgi:uncharacterized protein YndB with AHSA1/START domain